MYQYGHNGHNLCFGQPKDHWTREYLPIYLVPTPFPSGGAGSRVGYMIIELQFQVVAHSSKTFQYPLLNVHLTKIDPLLVYVLLTYPPRSCGGDDLKKVKV